MASLRLIIQQSAKLHPTDARPKIETASPVGAPLPGSTYHNSSCLILMNQAVICDCPACRGKPSGRLVTRCDDGLILEQANVMIVPGRVVPTNDIARVHIQRPRWSGRLIMRNEFSRVT